MRLIDSDLLKQDIDSVFGKCTEAVFAKQVINLQPTVDAVPVVRCKDCKFSKFHRCLDSLVVISCEKNINLGDENWYCADGQLREHKETRIDEVKYEID